MAATTTAVADGNFETQERENGLKRRQSEEPEETVDTKRQRTSPGKNSPPATRDEAAGDKDTHETPTDEQQPTSPGDTRRKPSVVDEKQRSKRLFGALLGNLRQPGDRASKRRQEIESRKKAELRKQDDERLEDRQRRLEQLAEQRKVAQVKVDEENVGMPVDGEMVMADDAVQMHRRHRTMLDKANFLQTETEPRLLYRPWDLRDDEEEFIDGQVRSAKAKIDEEVASFNERHERGSESQQITGGREADAGGGNPRLEDSAKAEGNTAPNIDKERNDGDAAAQAPESDDGANADEHSDAHTNLQATNGRDEGKSERRNQSADAHDAEDDGEHVQMGDEDAVIY